MTQEQRDGFGRYVDPPSREELERYFHLSDDDHKALLPLRGEYNRLGYATQLTSVRYLGIFPEDFSAIPDEVLQVLSRQLGINDPTCILAYAETRQRQRHAGEIQERLAIGRLMTPASACDLLAGYMRSAGQGQIVLVSCSIGRRLGC